VERINYHWSCSFLLIILIRWLYFERIQLMGLINSSVTFGILANFGRLLCGILRIEDDLKETVGITKSIGREYKQKIIIKVASKITNIMGKDKEQRRNNFLCCSNFDILLFCNVGQQTKNYACKLAHSYCIQYSSLHSF